MPRVTYHARKRMKERMGVNKSSVDRMADIAYEKGICHSDTTGDLHRWMDAQYLSQKIANNMRIYGETLYVFRDQTLITVLHVPNRMRRQVREAFARIRKEEEQKAAREEESE